MLGRFVAGAPRRLLEGLRSLVSIWNSLRTASVRRERIEIIPK
ncbi:hypothetical protein ACFQL0_05975 [Haloplanus litoreus]